MKASEQKKLNLEVRTADESAEVFIIDGRFKMVDRGRGLLNTFSLPPGIYTVKVRAGFESREEHVVLFDEPESVKFERIEFPSAAPLADTGKTHEYHIDAAKSESQRIHVAKGSGSSIFVFARDWTSEEKLEAGGKPNIKPQKGLKLLDARGEVVVDLDKKSKSYEKRDPWAACNVQVDPGIYRLALELASGDLIEQTVVASSKWQTQVFLLQRNYGEDDGDRRADLINASILLSKKGFNPDDPLKRLVETARLGLINTRQILSERTVHEILEGKFKNPMLGIFGAHLLLLGKQIKLDLLRIVVDNLRRLLGNLHPDVEALALRLGTKETDHIFEHPPMLRRSWWQVVDATIDKEGLVPYGSTAAQCADRIWGGEPWLQWITLEKNRKERPMPEGLEAMVYLPSAGHEAIELHLRSLDLQGSSTFELAMKDQPTEDQPPPPARSKKALATKGKKLMGGGKSRKGGKRAKAKSIAAPAPEASERKPKVELNKNDIRMMVKSSGLPRASVQVLFDQYKAASSAAAAAEAAQDPEVKSK